MSVSEIFALCPSMCFAIIHKRRQVLGWIRSGASSAPRRRVVERLQPPPQSSEPRLARPMRPPSRGLQKHCPRACRVASLVRLVLIRIRSSILPPHHLSIPSTPRCERQKLRIDILSAFRPKRGRQNLAVILIGRSMSSCSPLVRCWNEHERNSPAPVSADPYT